MSPTWRREMPDAADRRVRPHARPVRGRRLPAALAMARLAARTSRRTAGGVADAPRDGSLEQIRRHKHALLVTYRRDGAPVPTPVWAAEAEGLLYVRVERGSGKVKRLRREPRLLVAPCTTGGKPLGPPLEARAEVLAAFEDEARAERVLAQRYGFGRVLFELVADVMRVDMCYLQITPGS
jgi:PPOX class probable F420-dependent enzyme